MPGTNEPHGFSPDRHPGDELAGYDEAIEYLFGRIDYERFASDGTEPDFRLDRTAELFRRLGLSSFLHASYHRAEDCSAGDRSADDRSAQLDSGAPAASGVTAIDRGAIPIVHVAGTKGKGSTSTMVSSILAAAGIRVGLYTSPHLTRLNERFRVDGEPCRDDELVDLVATVRPTVEALADEGLHVSFFELTTAMAALYFRRRGCDAVVLEVGLGGRLDSTNVCASTVTAITSIGLDHQNVLGDTVEAIAREKAGIIKPNIPVVCGVSEPGPLNVILEVAESNDAPIVCVKTDYRVDQVGETATGLRFQYRTLPHTSSNLALGDATSGEGPGLEIDLPLVGHHQADNAATAISICRLLRQRLSQRGVAESPNSGSPNSGSPNSESPNSESVLDESSGCAAVHPRLLHPRLLADRLTDEAIRTGLGNVHCAGRLERFQLPGGRCTLVLDTAHNPDSIAALCQAIRSRIGLQPESAAFAPPIVLVFGTSRDKDIRAMTKQLSAIADHIICTQYQTNPRAMLVEEVEAAFRETAEGATLQIESIRDPIDALSKAAALPRSTAASVNGKQAGSNVGSPTDPASTVVVCGSFFLAGELRQEIMRLCDPDIAVDDSPARLLTRS